MRRTERTAPWANGDALTAQLTRHRALTRILVATLFLSAVLIASRESVTRAGPQLAPEDAALALPTSIGVGIQTDRSVTVQFSRPMDPASVAEALVIEPATDVYLSWSEDGSTVEIAPSNRWETDRRYLLTIGPQVVAGTGDQLGEAIELTFTTQTAPAVRRFEIVTPTGTEQAAQPLPDGLNPIAGWDSGEIEGASTQTAIRVEFTADMNREDVEDRFVIEPYVRGTFSWEGNVLSFTPAQRLAPDGEYTVSVAGATDVLGNPVGREAVFSFTTQSVAQVVSVEPAADAENVSAGTVAISFSQPMNVDATTAAFGLWDIQGAATKLPGDVTWNEERTQLSFVSSAPLGGLRLHAIRLGEGAVDIDGNPVTGEWRFWSAPAQLAAPAVGAPAPAPVYTGAVYAPGTPLEGYALEQINSARVAYGFPPLALDPAASAAASGHAWDQALNMYYSHTSLDGRTTSMRLRAAGAVFGLSGENQCYYMGMSALDTLNWCHQAFMAEPWPGYWNHIGNILGPDYTRVGIGIGEANGRVVITWNFLQ